MAESLYEWRCRKQAQGERLMRLLPGSEIESWQDLETKFTCVDPTIGALIFGQLPSNGISKYVPEQPFIDLTDEQVVEAFKAV